jgi:hypothetical protein
MMESASWSKEPAFHYNLGASWFALGHFDHRSSA